MLFGTQFHIFEQGKGKNQTKPHRHHLRDNITMTLYNFYIVFYVKATLFINSLSILSLVADILFSKKLDPFGHPNF